MRSESVNVHQENEKGKVVLKSHEAEILKFEEIPKEQKKDNDNNNNKEQVFFKNQVSYGIEMKENIWIAVCGASYHMTNSLKGMKDLKNDFS